MTDNKVRGYVVILNENEYNLLVEQEMYKNYNVELKKVSYFTIKDSNKINIISENGYVFTYKETKWNNHPSIDYLNDCVRTLYKHWFDLDGNNEYYIRDNTIKLKAIYHIKDNKYEEIDITKENNIENENSFPNSITLKNSPFYKKMLEKDPDIILKDKEGEFNAYSSSCQWNIRKQPVVITEKENT